MGEIFAGRYELVDPIGRGGVGAVWRSWDHRRRRYVAAKVLQQSDAHALLRFVREQALRIDHPHVLAPASWAADDDKVLFTMELVSGGSLAHVIGDYGPLPAHFVCTLMDQLLAGLAAVHAEGVVHRDIKPANILLEATGTGRPHLRLSDFGISMRKGEPRLTESSYVVGTPGYFGPEQMMGAEPDFPADLFAAGLIALYLLEGQKPDSQALVEHFAACGTPSAPQGIEEPLWQVIAGMLQPDPQARFRTATGARKALTAAAELLPEPGPGDEPVEIFDQIGPLPEGFGKAGPEILPPVVPLGTPGRVDNDPQTSARQTPARQTSARQTPAQPTPAQPPPAQPISAPPISAQQTPVKEAPAPHTPAPQQPQQPQQPPLSETGSFHLALPPQQPHAAQPSTPPTPTPAYPPAPPPTPYQPPGPMSEAQQYAPQHAQQYAPPYTRPYTVAGAATPGGGALAPQGGALAPLGGPYAPAYTNAAHAPAQATAQAPRKRPGPSPKVAVPVLLLAVLCFAVGIWALTQS